MFVLLFFFTISYRKSMRKKLNKKEHKLLIIYGMAMFIVDKMPFGLISSERKLNKAMKELCVKEDVEREKYLYIVQKVATCLTAAFITLIAAGAISISEKTSDSNNIKSLQRDNSKTITYEFVAQNEDGEKETLVVDVKNRQLTVTEIQKKLRDLQSPLVKKVLNENKSAEYVDKPLDLISSIGEDNVEISWDISDKSIVGYDGKIGDNVSSKGEIVTLTATMALNDVSLDYSFAVNIFPKNKEASLQKQVQKYVDENDIYDNSVGLPEKVDGQRIQYYEKAAKTSGQILVVGLALVAVLFFLKDRNIKKAVEKRRRQMLKDYSEIVSKILLYYGAGLSMKSVFEKIVDGYKKEKSADKKVFRYAYEELAMALIKMKSGVSELEAVIEYGNRCGLHCYIKLANIIEQNMRRGTKELTQALKNEVEIALAERKNNVLKEGEKMSTRLLGPMILMLVVSIAIIVIPAFMSMDF